MAKRSYSRTPLTLEQCRQLAQLKRCKVMPASWDQEFISDMCSKREGTPITINQAEWINRLCYRYRAQIGTPLATV